MVAAQMTPGPVRVDLKWLPPEMIRRLSAIRPWRVLLQIVLEWLAIAAAIVLCLWFWHPLLYLVCVAWIGARQHALGILMHEAVHYRLLRNRFWGDVVGNLCCAWPIFLAVHSYRRKHLAHHRNTNTDHDPDWTEKQTADWRFPQRPWRLALLLVRDAVGLNAHQNLLLAFRFASGPKTGKKEGPPLILQLGYYLAALVLFWYLGWLLVLFLFWIVPLLTWLRLILRVRGIAEHYALPNEDELSRTRTVLPPIWERLFIAPVNVSYHLEHHLYPSVTFDNLPRLHAELMKDPEYLAQTKQARSYFEVLRDCTRPLQMN